MPISAVVSEKKLEMWKVYRRRTPSDGNSSHGPLVQGKLINELLINDIWWSLGINKAGKYEWIESL